MSCVQRNSPIKNDGLAQYERDHASVWELSQDYGNLGELLSQILYLLSLGQKQSN